MSLSMLIIGAGYLGSETARQAVAAGFSPVILGRRQPKAMAHTQAMVLDVTKPETLLAVPPVDVVVYAVAAQDRSPTAYEHAYFTGLKNVLAHVHQWPQPPHLIYVSSTSVYAEEHGAWVAEDSRNLVTQGPSVHLIAGEQALMQSDIPYTVLRFGGIYGPERQYLVGRVRGGMEPLYQGEPIYSNRIHRDDGARAILHVAQHTACRRRILNLVDDMPADRNEVLGWLHQRLGLRAPLITTADKTQLAVRGNKRCTNRALRETGFACTYPSYREGYEQLLTER